MPSPIARISVAMPTRHEGITQVAAGLAEEGLLGQFLVPFDSTAVDGVLGRFLPAGHPLRRPLRQWRNEPRGASAAARQELLVSAAYRLPERIRRHVDTRRLVVQRYRAMARATRKAMGSKDTSAVILLQHLYGDALARQRPPETGLWLFVMGDDWDLQESLTEAAARLEPGPLKDEVEAEIPDAHVQRLNSSLARVTGVIVESARMASWASRHTQPGTPLVAIGQGVDSDIYRPGDQRDFSARPLRVVQLSRIVHGKGLLVADQAAGLAGSAVDSWSVHGWEAERSPVLARSLPNLHLPGPLPLRGAVRELQQADVFVLPTLGDSMPRAVLEGMAAGLPVITTDRSGYDEVIQHGENGFIVPVLDAEAIASLLMRLSHDGDLRRRVGLAARATAEQNTWGAVRQRFLKGLHDELLPSLPQS